MIISGFASPFAPWNQYASSLYYSLYISYTTLRENLPYNQKLLEVTIISTYCLIQWWYCWVKFDAYYSEQSNVIVKEKMTERVDLIAPPTTFEVWYQITISWHPEINTTLVITTNCGVSVGSTNNYVFRNFQQYTQKYPTK